MLIPSSLTATDSAATTGRVAVQSFSAASAVPGASLTPTEITALTLDASAKNFTAKFLIASKTSVNGFDTVDSCATDLVSVTLMGLETMGSTITGVSLIPLLPATTGDDLPIRRIPPIKVFNENVMLVYYLVVLFQQLNILSSIASVMCINPPEQS